MSIDYLKNKDDCEINLMFNNNVHISLRTETIEVRLEDQNEIKWLMKILNSNRWVFDHHLDLFYSKKNKIQSGSISVTSIIWDVKKNGNSALLKKDLLNTPQV